MNPLQKIRLMVARGIVKLVQDSGLQLMQLDLLDEETRDGVERVQNYGHRGHPPQGSTVATVAVAGSRDHLVVVACEHPDHVPPLAQGESAMYAMFGQLFKMDKDGNVTLTCKDFTVQASGNVTTSASGSYTATAGGNLGMSASGGMSLHGAGGAAMTGGVTADSIVADKLVGGGVDVETHDHGGVTAGGDNTGVPNK